jgi:hypothetical protein
VKPLTLALLAGGGALALIALTRRPSPAAEPRGFAARFSTFADAFPSSPAGRAIHDTAETAASLLGDWLRRVDPRPDPYDPAYQQSTVLMPHEFIDPLTNAYNYPQLGANLYRWEPGEGW